ncbi:tetratricopeptide repeat protein [Bradyrhizobium sp.]|uniref:tetratricopeptide repeat protein n=1 Tax=Bradyrhizobium sp. TaxID=376 RepID=UPI003C76C89F
MKKNRGFRGPPQRQVSNQVSNVVVQQRLQQAIALLQQQALALLQQGRLSDAKSILEDILKQRPNHFDALHLLGVIACHTKDPHQGEELFSKAIKVDPNVADVHNNRGAALKELKRLDEAVASYDKAITLRPDYTESYYNRGNALSDLKRLDEAVASYDKAIALKPVHVGAYCNRGTALKELKRLDEALASYEKAISLNPNYADAYNNHGITLNELKRFDEALASYDKAISLNPDYADARNNRGAALRELKRLDEAVTCFDKAISLNPDYAEAYNNRGNALNELNRLDEALASYDKAIALNPNYADAYNNRGVTLKELKRLDQAVASYDEAIALNPDLAAAYNNRGYALKELKRLDEALASFDKALSLDPDSAGLEGMRLHTKMHICDWTGFDGECAHLTSAVRNRKANTQPWVFIGISSSPDDQLQCAKSWVAEKFPPSQKTIWQGERYRHDRIRIAYMSADFHQHATSYLMAGMFECHDKSRFEVAAISIGPQDSSEMRQRLKHSFEAFIDAATLSDDEIASQIKQREIDLLIDLKGFTQDARTGVFARRPAPIQVNYLGYPGTMGANYIDYIIADRTAIPGEDRKFYSEKIAVLPNTYQANDRNRVISDKAFSRSDFGLPSQGVVFCCFNNNYKILPRMFDCWIRILKQVDGSVLWLLDDNASAARNLRAEAVARGVSSDRLVFAGRMPLPEHLARHKLADLFLDTLPCNAHTTASDALWAGLPVLTCLGETFAGRVAASLLNAIGLRELITTPEAYEQIAIDLARYPEKLAVIKRKLAANRLTTPLFDTTLFTGHIEAAYTAMYARHQAGLAPDHIVIAA